MKKVKISVRRTKEGTIFEIISMVLVVIMWGIVARMWNRLPNRLPSHFDMVGNVDEWSDKNTLILLGVIATITTISLLVSAYFPRKTVHIHERIQNLRQMALAVRMVRICAIATGLLFLGIIFFNNQNRVARYCKRRNVVYHGAYRDAFRSDYLLFDQDIHGPRQTLRIRWKE